MSDSNASNSNTSNSASGNVQDRKFAKVSGWSGVTRLGKEPTFDEVYGSGFEPMIVAHDKATQKIPSPMRIAFESVMFGPSDSKLTDGDGAGDDPGNLVLVGGGNAEGKYVEPKFIRVPCDGESPVNHCPSIAAPDATKNDTAKSKEKGKAPESIDPRGIDRVTDFPSLVPVAHKIAVDKGWWQDGIDKRPMFEIIANYHAEVSEAWEEYRAGRMKTWYAADSAKPEGFWVEIADLLIRIADTVGAGRANMVDTMEVSAGAVRGITVAQFISFLHGEIFEETGGVHLCERFAKFNNVDIYAVVREKLRYNVTRPHRHGGKLA